MAKIDHFLPVIIHIFFFLRTSLNRDKFQNIFDTRIPKITLKKNKKVFFFFLVAPPLQTELLVLNKNQEN